MRRDQFHKGVAVVVCDGPVACQPDLGIDYLYYPAAVPFIRVPAGCSVVCPVTEPSGVACWYRRLKRAVICYVNPGRASRVDISHRRERPGNDRWDL